MTPQSGSASWLRVPAAAAVAGLSPSALRRMTDTGALPCYRRRGGPRWLRRRDAEALRTGRSPDSRAGAPVPVAGANELREALLDLVRRLSVTVDLDETVGLLAAGLRDLADAADCDIWMPEADHLRCVASCDVQGFDRSAVGRTLPIEDYPLTQKILADGRPVAIASLREAQIAPAERAAMHSWGFESFLSIPMVSARGLVGLIDLYDIVPRDFSPLGDALGPSGDILAGGFAKAALLDRLEQGNRELRRQNQRLASLVSAGRSLTSTLVLEEVLSAVARTAAAALGSDECVIWEYSPEDDAIVDRSFYSPEADSYVGLGSETVALSDNPVYRRMLASAEAVEETISDPRLDPQSRESMERWGEKTCLTVPLVVGPETVGLLVLIETGAERRFTSEERELSRALADQAAAAIHNARLYRELEQRQRETELLNDIARKITSTLRVEDIAEATLTGLRGLVPFDQGSLLLIDEHGMLVTILSSDKGLRYEGMSVAQIPPGFVDRLRDQRVLLIDLTRESPLPADNPIVAGLCSGAVAGLFVEEELIGALSLGSKQPRAFSEHHRHVLTRIATHLSLALGNARLYENIRRLHLSNLKALSSALSAKDYYTLGHAARVAAYMVLLGKELGWPYETRVQAEEAAYLHDIGKIAISDRVLLKPSRLNTREWELMRQHPSFSADIISALFAPELVAAVRHHHERWDGAGYPDGLAGEAIPELAQAMCIVDSYDAMSSWRPYRNAMGFHDCLLELERCRGQQFDPRLVSAFRRVLERLACLHEHAGRVAALAAARIDAESHAKVVESGDMSGPDYAAIATVLREVRDQQPPTRFLTTIMSGETGLMIVVDCEEDATQHSPLGEPVLIDDELHAVLDGRELDINVVVVDEWGAWVSGIAPIHDESGAVAAVVNADLPAEPDIQLEGLRGDLSETFASLVHSAALRFSRAEVDAITDGLTGIFNHRYLHERLAEEVESTTERGSQLTLLFCDLDHFKQFNDRHGHSAGDAALRGVAQIVESSIRHVDLAARYGGEEFAVILVDTGAEAGMRVAERIRRRVARDHQTGSGAHDQHRHGHLPRRRRQRRAGDRPGRFCDVPGQAARPRPRGGLLRRPGTRDGRARRRRDPRAAPAHALRGGPRAPGGLARRHAGLRGGRGRREAGTERRGRRRGGPAGSPTRPRGAAGAPRRARRASSGRRRARRPDRGRRDRRRRPARRARCRRAPRSRDVPCARATRDATAHGGRRARSPGRCRPRAHRQSRAYPLGHRATGREARLEPLDRVDRQLQQL